MIAFCFKRLLKIKSFIFLILTGVLMSIFELVGIFSLGPFITMVISPEIVDSNAVFLFLKEYLNTSSNRDFITYFGLFTLFSIIFGNINNVSHQYLVHKISYLFGRDLSYEYTQSFLNSKPLNTKDFQNEDVVKNATVETVRSVEWVIQSIIGSIFRALSLVLIFAALLIYSWKISLYIGLIIFILYLLIFQTLRKWLSSIGDKLSFSLSEKQLAVSEIIHGKEIIKTDKKDKFFLNKFFESASIETNLKAYSSLAAFSPKAIMEGFAFGGITGVMIYINIYASESVGPEFLTSMGIFTVAAYKILPSAQNVYYGVSRAQFNLSSLKVLIDNYKVLLANNNESRKFKHYVSKKADFPYISINNISFSTNDENSKQILKSINIENNDQPFACLVGPSGGGKSTLLKLIAGLEEPDSGMIHLSHSIKKISYVSQNLVIFRGTLLDNITMFDYAPDFNLLEEIWKICELNFCDIQDASKLIISDEGANVSGGQNQRINLARSLYSKPNIMLLDEFTSALDNQMENSVLEKLKLYANANRVKVFMSAHRDSAKEFCDIFYHIKDGRCINVSHEYRL